MRSDLGVEADERDYAKQPLSLAELKELFAGRDPRDYINPKSAAFKAMGLKGKTLLADEALKLMAKEPNLLKRPLVIVGKNIIAGFDREQIRGAVG